MLAKRHLILRTLEWNMSYFISLDLGSNHCVDITLPQDMASYMTGCFDPPSARIIVSNYNCNGSGVLYMSLPLPNSYLQSPRRPSHVLNWSVSIADIRSHTSS